MKQKNYSEHIYLRDYRLQLYDLERKDTEVYLFTIL